MGASKGTGRARPGATGQGIWQLRLHGQPALLPPALEAAQAVAAVPLVLGPNDAAWLALVAIGPPRSAAQVAELVWPGSADRQGPVASLRQRRFRLQRQCQAELVQLGPVLGLGAQLLWQWPSAEQLRADPAIWDGDFLGEHAYDGPLQAWRAHQQSAMVALRRADCAALAAEAEAAGELARALPWAERLLAWEPLSEHALRWVMRLHHLRGDRAAALAAFQRFNQAWQAQQGEGAPARRGGGGTAVALGFEPTDETRSLLALVRATESALPATQRPAPLALLRPPLLVGRQAELARLCAGVAEGAVLQVVGEAGVGKTRLIEALRECTPGSHSVRARPADVAVPFALIERLARELQPDLGGSDLGAPALADVVRRGARHLPGLLVLEDLHFADPASLELLARLVDDDALAGQCWLFSHRPLAEGDAAWALQAVLHDAPRTRVLHLAPLDAQALADLVASLQLDGLDPASLAPALWRHSGGNPLYALETLRALRASGQGWQAALMPSPPSIGHLIAQRVSRLTPLALDLARVAAIAVPDFSVPLAECALALPAVRLSGAWAELEAADILRGDGFAHDLVHETVRERVPPAIARHVHRLVAEQLQRDQADPCRIAEHWWQAQAWAEAAAASWQAGVATLVRGRSLEASEQLWRAARAWLEAGNHDQAGAAMVEATLATCNTRGPTVAMQCLDELKPQLRDPRGHQRWLASSSLALAHAARLDDAVAAGEQALALRPDGRDGAAFEAVLALAFAQVNQGRIPEVMAHLQGLSDAAGWPAVPEPHQWLRYWQLATIGHLFGHQLGRAEVAIQTSLSLAQQLGHRDDEVTALTNMTSLMLRRGQMAQVIAHGQRLAGLIIQQDDVALAAAGNRWYMGQAAAALGRLRTALQWLAEAESALVRLQHNPHVLSRCRDHLALTWLALGQPARAQRVLDDDARELQQQHLASRCVARVVLDRALGRDAAADLQRGLDAAGALPSAQQFALELRVLATRDQAQAEPAIQALYAIEGEARTAQHAPVALFALVERVRRRLGPGASAPALALADAEALETTLDQVGHLLVSPIEALHLCARLHRQAGDAGRSARLLRRAVVALQQQIASEVPPELRQSFSSRHPVAMAVRQDDSRWQLNAWDALQAQALTDL